jgi:hypothetical protein
LLRLLVRTFSPEEPLVLGIDETLERRWRKKIRAKGIYRDPVRSTHERFVKTSGLRWICVMLLVQIPWATRVWALPFLSSWLRPNCSASRPNAALRATFSRTQPLTWTSLGFQEMIRERFGFVS